ncbi:MAG: hypothetical protein AAF355_03675 [Myxococcota bacterium]
MGIHAVRKIERPILTDGNHVAVAICTTDGEQQHVGLAYRTGALNSVRVVHLAFHRRLRDDALEPDAKWMRLADLPVPSPISRSVAAFCRLVVDRHSTSEIPYALKHCQTSFDKSDGKLLLGEGEVGLTCATFVLALTGGIGVRLLEMDSWPSRYDDTAWQEKIVEALRSDPKASCEHVAAVESEVGNCVRYRPEEVVAGAATGDIPATFSTAAALGEQVLSLLADDFARMT